MLVCREKAGFEDLHFIEGFPGVLEFTKLLFEWYFFSNCIQAALLNNSNVRWGRVCGPPTQHFIFLSPTGLIVALWNIA